MKWRQPEQLGPADLEYIDEAAGLVRDNAARKALSEMPSSLTAEEQAAIRTHCRFSHAAVFAFPPPLTRLRDNLQAGGLTLGEIAPSVAARDQRSRRYGRPRQSLDVGIRAPVGDRGGPWCEVEIFTPVVMPVTGLDNGAVSERANAYQAHTGVEVSAPDPVVRYGPRSTLIDRGRAEQARHTAAAFLTVPDDDSPRSRHKRELWQSLHPLQRALMSTDGSFTLLLAAVHGETVKTEPLSQSHCAIEQTDYQLQLEAGDQLLKRTALLKTVPSNRVVTYAESSIVLSRLSLSARQGLQSGSQPIGLVLRQGAIETHRVLHDWGACPGECVAPPAAIEYLGDIMLLFRTYTIIAHGLPIMLITEYFPYECSANEKSAGDEACTQ